jgi:hypothetical protein
LKTASLLSFRDADQQLLKYEASRSSKGVWTAFALHDFYTLRSTEPEENTDPDKYAPALRLNPADLVKLAVVPSIPPHGTPTEGN